MAKFQNILETVGNTPVVRINKLAPAGVNLFVKIEAFNPLGSVKDRLALGVIEAAEQAGQLKPGQTVIEATSGNTGIGLAMVCAQKGYPLVVTMAETFSVERRKLMRFLGAKVVLTPAAERGMGMVTKADELAKAHGWFLTRQFENEANPDIHSRTTAREIIEDFRRRAARLLGHRLRHRRHAQGRRAGAGEGAARHQDRRLRAGGRAAAGQRHAASAQSGRLGGGRPPGLQAASDAGLDARFHPEAHRRRGRHEGHRPHHPDPGRRCACAAAASSPSKEGIFVGITAGGTFAGALQVCREAPKGATILCMLPDTGERYLSTPLFADIPADMTEEELAISRSTPSAQMGA